ncbi:hypothetical protein OKA04_08810 [Luteolibacter flavescens]|uniref:Uncharacterized protein n=1 Tax=Luteolibacter flavescens TaxID=1859460 RepID=A0ABT3FNK4_9BACT|nr:hypothetical protein [Luteolibacter flavescens]MCW1884826.1 hypothetical protein [Luteolibacter flavescens]
MSEPIEITVERSAAQASQGLLLARIFASVLTLILLLLAMMVSSIAGKFGAMYAELGDAELPALSMMVTRNGGTILLLVLVLAAVTAFFIWSKGKMAAWMAGIGLLLMSVFIPVMVFAIFLPLVKIVSDMGNM